jgi:endonuclease III related protein
MEILKISTIYKILLKKYGPQGWWPVYSLRNKNNRNEKGYFINTGLINRSKFLSKASQFEIALGAILTQNTAWTNVEMAIDNLVNQNLLDPEILLETEQNILEEAIRPSGYYRQKAKKLKILAQYITDGKVFDNEHIPKRDSLLELWGIGNETADSILLYAYNVPVFVVDAYTIRIIQRIGILKGTEKYEVISKVFTDNIKKDFTVYQEFHALIVQHAKQHCKKKPVCEGCALEYGCRKKL